MSKRTKLDVLISKQPTRPQKTDEPTEGEDYYINLQGNLVFTRAYHLKRGYCCKNGCLHCPYGFKNATE